MTRKTPQASPEGAANDTYLSRQQALAILDIKPQTLYAYVSRGWIRSVRKTGGGKVSMFSREDVEKVKSRSAARTGHGVAAAGAMRWGEPIIPTSITEITAEGHSYRGRPALALARAGASFEAVAELLWSGLWFDDATPWQIADLPPQLAGLADSVRKLAPADHMIEILALFTLQIGMLRGTVAERMRTASPAEAARQLIQVMTGCLGLLGPRGAFDPMREGESVATALLRILGADRNTVNQQAVESMLVLLADHELTSSTFAARVAASAGALLHGCITAALATNSGLEIGRLYDRIEHFIAQPGDAAAMVERVRAIQDQGATPPGFNHPAYPRGDPRAEYLLALAEAYPRKPAKLRHLLALLVEVRPKMHLHPRVEMGVVALCLALRLPLKAAGAIFTLARSAGWVAHVLEQRTAGFMLRPRARYLQPSL